MIRELTKKAIIGIANVTQAHIIAEARQGQIDVLKETLDMVNEANATNKQTIETMKGSYSTLLHRIDQLEGERNLLLKVIKDLAGDDAKRLHPVVRRALKDLKK